MTQVFLGFGGNVGDVKVAFQEALKKIADIPGIANIRTSSLYRTSPVSDVPQPDYINCVVGFDCSLQALDLFKKLQKIESDLGRIRTTHHAPRTIDIDFLLYGDETIQEKELQIPHPRLFERLFVLVPLAELIAHAAGCSIKEKITYLQKSTNDTVIAIEDRSWTTCNT